MGSGAEVGHSLQVCVRTGSLCIGDASAGVGEADTAPAMLYAGNAF